MKVSLNWIKDYVDIGISAKELADIMTYTGTKAESWETLPENLQNIVVGTVLSTEKHPDADRIVQDAIEESIDLAYCSLADYYFTSRFTRDYQIDILEKTKDFFNYIYDDGNYSRMWRVVISVCHGTLGFLYFQNADEEMAIHYLRKSAELAIEFDKLPRITTLHSTLFEGKTFDKHELGSTFIAKSWMKENIENYPLSDEFKAYQTQVVKNAKALSEALMAEGFNLVSGGTDNHLMLIDLRNKDVTGKDAEHMLDEVGITVNKNTVPFETASPFVTSGVRIGTPAVTSRGMKEEDMKEIAALISLTINSFEEKKEEIVSRVKALTEKYPLYR